MLSTLLLLSSFTEFMAQQLSAQVDEGVNREPKQQLVEYQGTRIEFTHQYWRIQPDSICANRRGETDFDRCRQQAQALFAASCRQLSAASGEANASAQRAMYCAAAGTGTATASAALSTDSGGESPRVELQQGRRECHRLQFKSMFSDDPQLRAERDRVCAQAPQPASKP